MSQTKKDLAVPTVHLNGTSARELKKQIRDAVVALNDACRAHALTTPHGRDYYVQDTGIGEDTPLAIATNQYVARVHALSKVKDELMDIYNAIVKQEWCS